ncbi:D-serine ammonia-lyase [Pseudobacillus wudalianchiensis]|uniref:Probable D-serine dehydratase n=1 Tax=Pseudobacillus wudalianchiensis TaxID=1743143 RepID=A0A1B9AMZ9_9BACI|nr:D-serine ammonia-lyase [Bacillus wudalianchiensis]OCA85202.1 D-serine ammonia-lyase [Bacillus wudalianchiensis]
MNDEKLNSLETQWPLITEMKAGEEVTWLNERTLKAETDQLPITLEEIEEADARLRRFAPFLATVFPETKATDGIIESPLFEIAHMKRFFEKQHNEKMEGRLYLKADHLLPVAGSVKARGGMYEVLKHAESLAIENDLLSTEEDYSKLASDEMRAFFSRYSLAVGSTGNLGLSIGMTGAALGFQTTVHMSADAKEWKKRRLRDRGVTVIEYEDDYSRAVEEGRVLSAKTENSFFIDDEHSKELFLGYSTAALRLQEQFRENGIIVDADHPLIVYLPCGVGGAPGGIFTGLKRVFGEHVYGFFAEPVQAPCMLLGLMTGLHDEIAVQDVGIELRTEADGLAVGRPSSFVGKAVANDLDGVFTVSDDTLFIYLQQMAALEGEKLEPSALAGIEGPIRAKESGWLDSHLTESQRKGAAHLVWSTGGSLVPEEEMKAMIEKGEHLYAE